MSDCTIPYCGLCAFFTAECCDGYGYCAITERGCAYNNQCDLDYNRIGHDAVIYGLHYLQKWRRSNTDKLKMPPPYVMGKLIDAAIRKLRIYCV